jgi:hypothetical protein
VHTKSKTVVIAATASIAVGTLLSAATAAAVPHCKSYNLPQYLVIHQDNGLDVSVPTSDNHLTGRASYGKPGGPQTYGEAMGNWDGHNANFVMNWDSGGRNVYHGSVNDWSWLVGETTNDQGVSNNFSAGGLTCA